MQYIRGLPDEKIDNNRIAASGMSTGAYFLRRWDAGWRNARGANASANANANASANAVNNTSTSAGGGL
jgi:hypothetical protein